MRIIHSFISLGTTDGLDASCVANVRRPPFFVTPAGPATDKSSDAPTTPDTSAGHDPSLGLSRHNPASQPNGESR
jgi:hypothetical protein